MKFNNLENMISSMGLIDELALLYYDYMKKERLYLDKYPLNMIEIHFLTSINKNSGILISDLAKKWNRNMSSISKTVTKLEKKGYLKKVKLPDNNKNIHLYLTDIGLAIAKEHENFDFNEHSKMISKFLENHSEQEIESFSKVMESVLEYFYK